MLYVGVYVMVRACIIWYRYIMYVAYIHTYTHTHIHTDAVDPLHAPATGTTVRGGLTFREAHYVAESVSESGMLGSLDMVWFWSCFMYAFMC